MSTVQDLNFGFAELAWNDDNQPIASRFNDVYFSTTDGIAEKRYTFLENNNLSQRWQQQSASHSSFTIAETGFGTGLNFLLTWQLWLEARRLFPDCAPSQLHYISLEKHPISWRDLKRIWQLWPQLQPLSDELLDAYPPLPTAGCVRLILNRGLVHLTLYIGDAATGLQQFSPCSDRNNAAPKNMSFNGMQTSVDAWYLDGFSPARNPDIWSHTLFAAMARLSHADTTFATFTSARLVKEGLLEAGFQLIKKPGFGLKREVICGNFQGTRNCAAHEQGNRKTPPRKIKRGDTSDHYWHLQELRTRTEQTSTEREANQRPIKSALVIGGGIAGCNTAFALSQRGIQVTLLEQSAGLADGASGNRQGVVYTKLSPHPSQLNQFNLCAQIFANQYYAQKLNGTSLFDRCGGATGVLHLAVTTNQVEHYRKLAQHYDDCPQFLQWLSPEQASEKAGVELNHPALWLPNSGWLAPHSLCEQLTSPANIDLRLNCKVAKLELWKNAENGDQETEQWHAYSDSGDIIASADTCVIANAGASQQFSQTAGLPLKPIRGQVTHLSESAPLAADWQLHKLSTTLCGRGYITPVYDGYFSFGASFNLNESATELNPDDHQVNLDNLASMLTHAQSSQQESLSDTLEGRVGFRSTTPDYFPIVGPVPNQPHMLEQFAPLRHKANAIIDASGSYYPQLYTLLGLGSRGLAYSPLAAELIASLICNQPLPVDQQLYRYLHPARFLIRNLIRSER